MNFGKDKQKEMDDEKDITFFKKTRLFLNEMSRKFHETSRKSLLFEPIVFLKKYEFLK